MNLPALFYPKSIAVIGASSEEKAVGNDIAENLVKQGFAGQIYLINPKIKGLHGLATFASIQEVPGDVDLIILAIPSKVVSAEIVKASKKNVKAAIVISAGFKESGNKEIEEELAKTCSELDITLVGPNCLGVINPEHKMNASFAKLMPPVGNVAFISQSGALCTAILDYAMDLGIGFSKFLSIGNKALLGELDLIEYLYADEKTKVICIYAESLENAPAFISKINALNQSNNPKPIIILKSGKTQAGSQAIASHTGSLSSDDSAYNALFQQAGMIRVATISELFDLLKIFDTNPIQKVENVAIVTNAGGPGVLTTDVVVENGLKLAKLSDETVKQLTLFLAKAASLKNPIDILGDASAVIYEKAIQLIISDQGVDALIVLLTPQSMTEPEKTAKAIIEIRKKSNKPIVVSLMGKALVADALENLRRNKIATMAFPESAAKALALFSNFNEFLKKPKLENFLFDDIDKQRVSEIFSIARDKGQTRFPEAEALEIMRAYNFPTLQSAVVKNVEGLIKTVKSFKGKIAIKIISADILHKSDSGGVKLNIDENNILTECKVMLKQVRKNQPTAKIDGILLMEMAKTGQELILGISKNSLGSLIMCGLGGIYVEVLKDVSFAFAPLSKTDALAMLKKLRTYKILEGVRGQKGIDIDAVVEVIVRLSHLATDFPEIAELDINPLIATSEGVKVLDARIVIK